MAGHAPGGQGLIVMLKVCVAVPPRLSVTFIVNANVPALVGVPDKTLLMRVPGFPELKVKPLGTC
jgi:hypothetical protein